ncbi:MAG: YhfC family intramembrane metalloprotease [Clostridiales bacterium]|jgi:uncharacterized membrane protein YhfC|nr:YhfC family intramembrane metalloprotease [Clostridiales bacterium]
MAVPQLSILFMSISLFTALALPLILLLAFRKVFSLKIAPFFAGYAGYFIFSEIAKRLLDFLALSPDASGVIALTRIPALYALYIAATVSIFEESARLTAVLIMNRRWKGVGLGISYGIGHGGCEAIFLVGLAMAHSIKASNLLNSGSQAIALNAASIADANPFVFLVGAMECIPGVAIQISLSIIVWLAAANGRRMKRLFPVAALLHAAAALPAALMQAGIIGSLFAVEAAKFASAVFLTLFALCAYKVLCPPEYPNEMTHI